MNVLLLYRTHTHISRTHRVEQFISLLDVFRFQWAKSRSLCLLGQTVQFQSSLHCHVTRQMRKLDVYQLLRVQGTVPVPVAIKS